MAWLLFYCPRTSQIVGNQYSNLGKSVYEVAAAAVAVAKSIIWFNACSFSDQAVAVAPAANSDMAQVCPDWNSSNHNNSQTCNSLIKKGGNGWSHLTFVKCFQFSKGLFWKEKRGNQLIIWKVACLNFVGSSMVHSPLHHHLQTELGLQYLWIHHRRVGYSPSRCWSIP